MNTDVIERAMQIVEEVLELDRELQSDYLECICGEDDALRREVESMLIFESGVSITGTNSLEQPNDVVSILPTDDERYEIGEEIGRGGMGTVFTAHDHVLDRCVAVKVLRHADKASGDSLARFAAEAQIGAKLQHPGIAPVYDLGRLPDDRPFFAMKLVAGETLASMLSGREGPHDNRSQILAVFEQLCQTVAYAHSHGIIHRDLKPDNVMVGEFGEVQVMDWGLAKVLSNNAAQDAGSADLDDEHERLQSPAPSWTPSSHNETRVGIVMGTPAYMPPEQAVGKRGKPTDVFSLGAILCEILTGSPPYTAESPAAVYEKSTLADLQEATTRLENCEADAELVDLAKRCLQPDSEDRPSDASEVANRFSNYLETVQSRLREAELKAARSTAAALVEKNPAASDTANDGDGIAVSGCCHGGLGLEFPTTGGAGQAGIRAAGASCAETERCHYRSHSIATNSKRFAP